MTENLLNKRVEVLHEALAKKDYLNKQGHIVSVRHGHGSGIQLIVQMSDGTLLDLETSDVKVLGW